MSEPSVPRFTLSGSLSRIGGDRDGEEEEEVWGENGGGSGVIKEKKDAVGFEKDVDPDGSGHHVELNPKETLADAERRGN